MTVKDLTPPPTEPIDLAYAKTFLRVDHDEEDALISDLIRASRERTERQIRTSLITRRQLYTTDCLSDSGVFINHGPVTAVHDLKVIDPSGSVAGVSPTDYQVDLRSIPAHLCLRAPFRWHDFAGPAAHVEIEIDAGYGTEAADVPMPLRQAVLLLLAQSYEYRDRPDIPPMPMMVDALLMPYRSIKL